MYQRLEQRGGPSGVFRILLGVVAQGARQGGGEPSPFGRAEGGSAAPARVDE